MDNESLIYQIELHLLAAGGWVSTREICEKFGLTDRSLRQAGDRPALLDKFAVSSTSSHGASGYIHHKFLPTSDWLPIKHRLRRHAIAELRRVRSWDRARTNILTRRDGRPTRELHTGQLTFFK
jgi:hypothetical protein